MIESTFWYTSINFWPTSVSEGEGSLRISIIVLCIVHSVSISGHRQDLVSKIVSISVSCLKTDRDHSFLSYHKGYQIPEMENRSKMKSRGQI